MLHGRWQMLNPLHFVRTWRVRRQRKSHSSELRALLGGGRWCVDFVERQDGHLVVCGWALPPDGKHARLQFRVNGLPFDRVDYPMHRADLGEKLWFIPGAAASGFKCSMRLESLQARQASDLCLQLLDRNGGQDSNSYLSHHYPAESMDSPPLPDSIRMERVHGTSRASSFCLVGFSAFVNMERALQTHLGKGYEAFPRVLDWGCGSGRILRYFRSRPNSQVVGIDIDPDNIAWCRQNMPFARFETVSLHPPTSLPAESFNLLVGTSVFTHLKEPEQFAWLEELQRLAAPGAALLMTCHGESSVGLSHMPRKLFRRWAKQGLIDIGPADLPGIQLPESDYYRNTYHSNRYIREQWSRFFEIVAILPGYIGSLQDLVIMRKR
jgi:SAM-dependent methyltransferase